MTASFAADIHPVALADPLSGYAFTADTTGGTAHKGDLGALPSVQRRRPQQPTRRHRGGGDRSDPVDQRARRVGLG